MFTSMSRRRLSDAMLAAIHELTTVRPHARNCEQFTPAEWRIYREGYYWGVVSALRVAALAVERFQLAVSSRRAAARRKRIA